MLYLASTLFVCYLAFSTRADAESLNALFWIVILFAATNTVSGIMAREPGRRRSWINTMASQTSIILSRIIYNAALMLVLGLITYAVFAFLLGDFVRLHLPFVLLLCGGSIGFAVLMTFVSSISGRIGNHFAMTAVLGFPLAIPLLVLCIDLGKLCNGTALPDGSSGKFAVLFLLDGIMIALAYILYPFLWRK
jgi:heme exporter protein B